MSDLSIDRVIREVIDDLDDLTDPTDITDAVIARIDQDIAHHYLRRAVRPLVVGTLGAMRNNALNRHPSGHSAKRRAQRAWWETLCRENLKVGEGRWIKLGDATEVDLAYAEKERRRHAAAVLEKADYYSALRQLLVTSGAQKVADLDPTAVRELAA